MSGVLLVTGGASGIGAAVVKAAAQNYAIAINYRSRQGQAQELADKINSKGGKAIIVAGDVGDEAAVINMFNTVYAELGAVTALVNSAGISLKPRPFIELDAQDLTNLLSTNITGTILCTREAVKQMSTKSGGAGGAIVNISSMATTMGGRLGAVAFAASKGAVDIFTKGLAKEVAGQGIRINAVRPGQTHSDMTDRLKNPEIAKAMAETIPMGRIARVEEIAEPVMWLLSENASFVTGAIVDAGGGGVTIGPENPLLVGQSF